MTKFLFLLAADVCAVSAMSVSLGSSAPGPAPVGTIVRFSAGVSGAGSGPLSYRFRVQSGSIRSKFRPVASEFRTIVDYGPNSTLDWTTIDHEGKFNIEVSVRDASTGAMASDSLGFTFTKVATGSAPAATGTANPLVFVYSAPPCPAEARMRVRFQAAGGGAAQYTPYRQCNARTTMNFYLAGMLPNTAYTAVQTIESAAGAADGPAVPFTTGALPFTTPAAAPISTPVPASGGILLHAVINSYPMATDLNGNVVWYGPSGMTLLTRPIDGGTFLGIYEDGAEQTSHQFFREFDLAGITVAETNAARVNEQLAAMGRHPITSFHHDAIRMPDGDYLVLAGSERILTDVQGPGPVDVLGDIILVLDRDLKVKWFWDAFDYLDPHRAALLNETCAYPATVACSAFYQAALANDWLHGNALQRTPDGDILYSIRHQDWIVKIDYRDGAGTGKILWKLGAGGDFQITGGGAHPWFSHQHDPHFLSDNTTLLLFDNGNTRIADNPSETSSRGQALRIDEQARTATVLLNANLKVNSSALGSAQLLDGGDYHFNAGFIVDPANPNARFTQALETDASGNIVWGMQVAAQEYRNFRMKDLYTPPQQ